MKLRCIAVCTVVILSFCTAFAIGPTSEEGGVAPS